MPVQPAGISFVDETPPGGRCWREPNAKSISKIATPITDPIFHMVIIRGTLHRYIHPTGSMTSGVSLTGALTSPETRCIAIMPAG
jgi:hypothetical protein